MTLLAQIIASARPGGTPPAVEYAGWGDSEGATLASGDRTLTWGGTPWACGYAVSDVPLAGKQRWQCLFLTDYAADPQPEDYFTAAGVWSRLPEEYWGGAEIFHSNSYSPSQPAAGISPTPYYTPIVVNGAWGFALNPADESMLPWWVFEFCSQVTFTGTHYVVEVWIRQVTPDGVSAWMGEGDPDPVAGTDATIAVIADNPWFVGASVHYSAGSQVTLLHPSDFLPTPPVAGFATGIVA